MNTDTPVPCTNTGAFRRVFSPPAQTEMDVSIVLPQVAAGAMLPGDVGFVYAGGWAKVSSGLWGQPIDSGFQYSVVNNHYTLFIAGGNRTMVEGASFLPGQTVNLDIQAIGNVQLGAITVTGYGFVSDGSCQNYCASNIADNIGLGGSGRWGPENIVYKKMVSIAQSAGNDFNDGDSFGPFTWEPCSSDPNCTLLPSVGNGNEITQSNGAFPWLPWSAGGYQSWPDDSASPNPRVSVDFVSPNVETDTINLHP